MGYSPGAVLVRVATSVERTLTNLIAGFLRVSMGLLKRVMKRGEHRDWRREQAEADARRRSGGS
jgi:hypothetical protein